MSENGQGKKSPILALVLSAVFPGLGQVYTRQVAKGISIALLNIAINLLLLKPLEKLLESPEAAPDNPTLFIVSGYTIAGLVLWVYAVIDAKKTAEKMSREKT